MRSARLWVGLLALAGAACASVPARAPAVAAKVEAPPAPPPLPEVTFRSGEPPRRALVMTAVLAAPASTVAALDALARRLSLPAPIGRDLLGLLQGGVAPWATLARLDRLDPASPIALVQLTAGIGVEDGLCAAVTFKDAAMARQTLDELGVETSRKGGESARRLPSGATRYFGVHGRTLLIASTPRTIAIAGPLAEELQSHPVGSAARVTLYPRVLFPLDAAAIGSFFETRVVGAIQASDDIKISAKFAGALARAFGEVVAESRAITLTVDVNETAGLAIALSIEPLAESSFARALDRRFPFAVDPTVFTPASAGLISWGGFGAFLASFGAYVETSGPKGRELRAASEAFLSRLRGPCTCAVDRGAPLDWQCAWPLQPGVKTADVLRRYAEVMKRGAAWVDEVLGRRPDDSPRRFPAVVRGGALVTTVQASEAGARSLAPVTGRSAGLSEALGGAAGANFVAYVDLVSFLMRLASESADANVHQAVTMIRAIPGLESLHVPFVLTGRSGATARYELQVPVEGLQNAARIVVPYMGTMGGKPRR